MTTSTKPEVHIILQRRQRGPSHGHMQHDTRTENFTKFGCVFPEICVKTGRQTDRQTRLSQYFAPLPDRSDRTNRRLDFSIFRMAAVRTDAPLTVLWSVNADTHDCRPQSVYILARHGTRFTKLSYMDRMSRRLHTIRNLIMKHASDGIVSPHFTSSAPINLRL